MKHIRVHWIVFHSMWLIIFLLFAISYFGINDANACLSNPLVYGADKATSDETGELFCSCTFSNPSYSPLYFNHENMSTKSEDLFSEASPGAIGVFIDDD